MILLDSRIFVIDNFFKDVDSVIAEAKNCSFNVKDALYHGKDADRPIPAWMEAQIVEQVNRILPFYFWFNKAKFRLAVEGDNSITRIPHTDSYADVTSPKFSIVIYLADPFQGNERLGFFEHDSFGKFSLAEFENASGDKTRKGVFDPSQWTEYCNVPVKKNRAVMFPASLFHMPLPGIGFGKDAETGRLILPVFIHIGYRPTHHSQPVPQIVVVT